ncbi:serine hydrolase [Synechococcus sp. ATX 2A4]|uniref:serine hydrolase n=1 Tax=Synechococcus sp. ATX 2A4 TaxID=2823727 RepID=UPI0020CE671E|nr:serine hydrolase [Synechococcus sp. ATX 2A4]MCP9884874.1 serine hydrolase [Synechococcus sp. ATX 2A4]
MSPSRRFVIDSIGGVALGSALSMLLQTGRSHAATAPAPSGSIDALNQTILTSFKGLRGEKGFLMQSPAPGAAGPGAGATAAWEQGLNPGRPLFCGSSFKVYVLAEFLRQLESGKVSLQEQLPVNDSVRSLSSEVLENVSGTIPASVALEAMIMHSDNTATDLVMQRIGAGSVRALIASLGLPDTRIPTSTRQFFSYLLGAPVGVDLGWQGVKKALDDSGTQTRPIINDQETMVGSPADFVRFYSMALQGELFSSPSSLIAFRRILALPPAITVLDVPRAHLFLKGGSLDFTPDQVMSLAGGMRLCNGRWITFSFQQNWQDTDPAAAKATVQTFVDTIAAILQAAAGFFGG